MWGSAPHPGSVARGDPCAPLRSLATRSRAIAFSSPRHRREERDLIPVVHHPDRFRILVGGGAGKHSAILPAGGWGSITIPLELPD